MIQEQGKIKVPNAKASEAVQKALFAKGHEWSCSKSRVTNTHEKWLGWGLYGETGVYVICESGWDFLPTHTLAAFGLTPEGEPLPKFKDGDRVVCDEALKQVISEGGLSTTYDAYKEPFVLGYLNPEALEATNEHGRFNVSNNGIAYDVNGNFLGHVLHAPTFGNLKPGDANPFVVGMEVEITFNGKQIIVKAVEAEYGPRIRIQGQNGNKKWYGFKDNGCKIGGEFGRDINTIFPVEAASQPKKLRFKLDDPAIDTKGRKCTIMAIAGGYALCDYGARPGQKHPVRAVELRKLRPRSAPIQFPLNDRTTIQVDENGVSFINEDGIQSGPLSIIDELVEARAKMQA